MRRLYLLLLLALPFTLALSSLWAQEPRTFKLVVHPDNPTTSVSRKDVANFFLRKVSAWPAGSEVEPIDQQPQSQVRESFSRAVHRRDVRSILSYWQRQVFSGRSTPPPEADNDDAAIAFVRGRRGAIGYVSAAARAEGVKVLTITDLEEQ